MRLFFCIQTVLMLWRPIFLSCMRLIKCCRSFYCLQNVSSFLFFVFVASKHQRQFSSSNFYPRCVSAMIKVLLLLCVFFVLFIAFIACVLQHSRYQVFCLRNFGVYMIFLCIGLFCVLLCVSYSGTNVIFSLFAVNDLVIGTIMYDRRKVIDSRNERRYHKCVCSNKTLYPCGKVKVCFC